MRSNGKNHSKEAENVPGNDDSLMLAKKPLSLYIHIPFCVRKCLYCDFLSGQASEEEKEAYVKKLLEEMEYWKQVIWEKYFVRTVFLGGGTPTCLKPSQLLRIGRKLSEFPLGRQICGTEKEPDALQPIKLEEKNSIRQSCGLLEENTYRQSYFEFTVEANPGTLTKEKVQVLKEIGVNRVSLGLQSAQEQEIKALGRIHTYQDFLESFELLRNYNFQNINVDLMADIPKQTVKSYQSTLSSVLALEPEHISSYSLIVEEGTPFFKMQEEGILLLPEEEIDRKMYCMTQEMLSKKGYKRYEISNYAKQGKECRHNLTYWEMGEYLGIGLGASSFFQGYRFSNMDRQREYLSLPVDNLQKDSKQLPKKDEMEEYVFLGLRMRKGISLQDYKNRFGLEFKKCYQKILPFLFENCLLAEDQNHGRIYLTDKGIDVSNVVLAEFLLESVPE